MQSLSRKVDKIIIELNQKYPEIPLEVFDHILKKYSEVMVGEFNNYSIAQYRMYKNNPSLSAKDDPYFRSVGADKCVEIVESMFVPYP